MISKLKFSFIASDTPRLRSYLHFFSKEKFRLDKIFLLKKNSTAENLKFLNNSYFDNSQKTFDDFIKKNKSKIKLIDSNTANNANLIKNLLKTKSKYVIFCSNPGDILKKDFFNINKKIIHVHPGDIFKYKGSTPYYYQIIEKKSLTFTSFFMQPKLDSGKPIISETHKINDIKKVDLKFLDEIYDPFLRGKILIKTLNALSKKETTRTNYNKHTKRTPFFIIHPVLKYLSINNNSKMR